MNDIMVNKDIWTGFFAFEYKIILTVFHDPSVTLIAKSGNVPLALEQKMMDLVDALLVWFLNLSSAMIIVLIKQEVESQSNSVTADPAVRT